MMPSNIRLLFAPGRLSASGALMAEAFNEVFSKRGKR
jgi:hypothetical protein